MKLQSSPKYLLGTASVLALLATAGGTTPAQAQVSTATRPIYFGGSTLASEAFRQLFDCYSKSIVGQATNYSDGFTFGSPPAPGVITTSCSPAASTTVNGLYAGVGSGNGVRGYIANNPQQWYGGTITPPASGTAAVAAYLPALQPSLIDLANPRGTVFGSYPYPRVDAGLSDSPLAIASGATTLTTVSLGLTPTQGWMIPNPSNPLTYTTLANITVAATTSVISYNPTAYGPVIQIPAFEVNVAIAVNTDGLDKNHSAIAGVTTNTLPATQANQGAAIQLTPGQLCAIYSGLVTDWNDTTGSNVPYLTAGHVPVVAGDGQPALGAFHDANGGTDPYSSSSKNIVVVFRSDGSGTSFILTNYLKSVCPLLDPTDAKKYVSIFGASNLPSTSFQTLIDNIKLAKPGTGAGSGAAITATWIPANGSGGVATAVSSNDSSKGGRIGYVSADFTKPYTTTIAPGVTAPLSAALMNEQLRISGLNGTTGITVPNIASGSLTGIAPTPAGAFNAWSDGRLRTTGSISTWGDFNIYNNTFTTPTSQGGLALSGQSVLPLTNVQNAYPLSGTTFLDLYTCYSLATPGAADTNRVTSLRSFLTWYFSTTAATVPTTVMQQAGFNPIPAGYLSLINSTYLSTTNANRIAAAGTTLFGSVCSTASGAL